MRDFALCRKPLYNMGFSLLCLGMGTVFKTVVGE